MKCKYYLASQRQQPSPHEASNKAARLVWIGPDSPLCPVAITIHSKSNLQRQPTQKRLCLNPLCTRFSHLSWLTCLTTCLPVMEEEALYASMEMHLLPNTCFVWYVMTALYRCLRKTNEWRSSSWWPLPAVDNTESFAFPETDLMPLVGDVARRCCVNQ